MAEIARVRVQWTGWPGGPGVSTHFMSGTDYSAALTALNNFYDAVHYSVPTGISLTVQGSGDIIDEATGALTGQWQHGSDTGHAGSGSSTYMAAEGWQVRWNTSQIHNGRRLAGRTFFVPLSTSYIGPNGLLDSTQLGALQSAANACVTAAAGGLVVWGRPRKATATLPSGPGISGAITTATVPSKTVVLRSRRD